MSESKEIQKGISCVGKVEEIHLSQALDQVEEDEACEGHGMPSSRVWT